MRSTEHAATTRRQTLQPGSEKQVKIDLVRSTLKQNGYPDKLLHRKKPVKKQTKNMKE